MEQKKVTTSERNVLKAIVGGSYVGYSLFQKTAEIRLNGKWQFNVRLTTIRSLLKKGLIDTADKVTEQGREGAIKGFYTV